MTRSRQLNKSIVGIREEQMIEDSRRRAKGLSPKYRLNHCPGLCMKFDCPGRDKQCDDCLGMSVWKKWTLDIATSK